MTFRLIGLIGLIGLFGPISRICAQDTNTLFLHVDGSVFFIDNEYFGDRVSGYTLPGFVLQPKVEWKLHDKVTLNGGFHWLNYWGARDYPATTTYGAYPLYDSMSRPLHLLPWLQAKLKLSQTVTLLLGCLENSNHHNLPMPLYNQERTLVADPETGFQLNAQGRWFDVDIWTDWREFIWDRSPMPERFTAGISGELNHTWGDKWIVYLPLNFIVQHEGGQNMSVSHNINNNFNASAGLGVANNYPIFNLECYFDLNCRVMWYHQHGNAAVPFSNGWGIYPEMKLMIGERWSFLASYWHGKDFVPLLGSWHFSNLSANTTGLTFDRTRVVTMDVRWRWNPIPCCGLTFHGTLYHYLPSTGTFTDGTTTDYGHRNQFSVGVAFNFCPIVRLF
ncbi:MAG: hypothetical protein ACSW8I_07245 [bacterium]